MAEVDFFADQPHYLDHLAPIWLALPEENRGQFLIPNRLVGRARELGVEPTLLWAFSPSATRRRQGPVLVAAWGGVLKWHRTGRKIILLEHGSGQTFQTNHPSYAGGDRRGWVDAYLQPGPHSAEAILRVTPSAAVFQIGCAKLDRHHAVPPKLRGERPVVAFSTHWDCKVMPETRASWPEYGEALLALRDRYDLLAHAHPLYQGVVRPAAEAVGVEFVEFFDEVLDRADLYISDGSSTLYEFASTGRPVLVLNSQHYRRDVHHGLRFWDAVPGAECDGPDDLPSKVEEALADPVWARRKRAHGVARAYVACDGKAAQRGAEALLELLEMWR
jgi:hypothetical protein